MAGATLATVDAALKETWTEDRLAQQLYDENPFLARIKRLKNTKVGQQAVTPIHTSRNGGWTALPAGGGTLNTAGQQGMTQATWLYKNFHQQVLVQGEAIDGTSSDVLSVAEAVDLEVSGAVSDLNRQLTRMLQLNGDALTAQCGTTNNSTTVTLSTTTGYDALVRGWIGVGSVIDIGTTSSEATIADAVTVTAVSEVAATPTITISGSAVTTTSSHYVSMANARAGTTSYEMNGLKNLISTSDVGNVSVSSYPVWAPASVDTTSQALTLSLMLAKQRAVMQKTGKFPTYILTSLKQQENFYRQLQSQVRFGSDGGSAGNVGSYNWNGSEINAQPDTPDSYMYFLTIEDLRIMTAGDPYWTSKVTGGQTLFYVQGTDGYGGKITVRLNTGLARRNSHAVFTALT